MIETDAPSSRAKPSPRWGYALLGGVVAAVLAGVFAMYLQPHWVMQLSQLLWTCL